MALACAVFALLGWGVSGEFRTYRIGSSCILKPRQVWSSLVCSLANYFTARLGLPETSTVTKYETAERMQQKWEGGGQGRGRGMSTCCHSRRCTWTSTWAIDANRAARSVFAVVISEKAACIVVHGVVGNNA